MYRARTSRCLREPLYGGPLLTVVVFCTNLKVSVTAAVPHVIVHYIPGAWQARGIGSLGPGLQAMGHDAIAVDCGTRHNPCPRRGQLERDAGEVATSRRDAGVRSSW